MAESRLITTARRRPRRHATQRSNLPAWWLSLLAFAAVVFAGAALAAQTTAGKLPERWAYFQKVTAPTRRDSPWIDVVLPTAVFDAARVDLGDLRLHDSSGATLQYALRVLRPEHYSEEIKATEVNRVQGPGNSSELSLDLQGSNILHNQVEVQMSGENFRRRARLEGRSDKEEQWRVLVKRKNLIYFVAGGEKIKDCRISYPPSRFRYLRLSVYPDPNVDEHSVHIERVTVQRRVDVPGEMVTRDAVLEPREPVRANGAEASAWMIQLGGENVPVEQLDVEIRDSDFVRDYIIEVANPVGSRQRFRRVSQGVWRRRPGETVVPMVAKFGEVRAARLKLTVIDHKNPPLNVRSVKYTAPVRQVVFAVPKRQVGNLMLAYGNPKAEDPHYDFAGNLPVRLKPAAARAAIGPQEDNPSHVPEPLPFTERWPWVIYVVLSSVSMLLGGVIFSVGRKAIATHDAQQFTGDSS